MPYTITLSTLRLRCAVAARLILCALSLVLCDGRAQDSLNGPVDRFVATEMARQQVPGAAVAVIDKGVPVLVRGYGLANLEHQVAVGPETIFQSGSLGKQFTAVAVMLQVEDGRLALSDPLTKFFPDAPASWQGITVRHLLTHTSGIPDYEGKIDTRKDYSEEELARFAYAGVLDFPAGSSWNYSNTGYVLLGIIVRKVSGSFYGDVLAERVFKPLGMKTARIISEADIVPHRAAGYTLASGGIKNQEWVSPSLNTTADGALYLTVLDLVAWDAGVRSGAILKPASWKQVFTPVTLNSGATYPYGFAWFIERRNGQALHQHSGAWQGFKTQYSRFVDADLSVIVLTNLAQANPAAIADGVAATLRPALKLNPANSGY